MSKDILEILETAEKKFVHSIHKIKNQYFSVIAGAVSFWLIFILF